MEYSGLSKRKSWLYWLMMLMMIHLHIVWKTQGDCIEEERKTLLEIKASHMKSFDFKIDHFLPTWIDYVTGDGGGDCCDWERVGCSSTTGHVTELSLYKLRGILDDKVEFKRKLWPLNVSLFLHFKELRSLNLSNNFLDKENMKTGFERLSSLKNLEVLDLSLNYIDNNVLQSLRTLASLKILDLSRTSLNGNLPVSELSHLINLEELNLSESGINGTPDIQACKSISGLKKLESIDLSYNRFNKSIISCLSSLPSLKILHLSNSFSWGSCPFPFQEFRNLFDLEVLLLGSNGFNGTLPMQAFTSFHNLRVLDMSFNNFVGSIPSTIQTLSSLRSVSFGYNLLNGSLSDHGLCELKNLHELDISGNMLDGTLPLCFTNLSSLKLLDISSNRFTGLILPSLIANLTSLEYIDCTHNRFEGSFLFSSLSNHTKLEVVRFGSEADKFEVETEEPIGWFTTFQLKVLVLSNCNIKRRKGRVVLGFLLHQHKLQELDLSHNSMDGKFPNWLIKNNTNLEALILRNNSFSSMPLYWNANMHKLDMSGNQMIGSIPDDMPNFYPNIIYLILSTNSLSGAIPSSIGDLRRLMILDLSYNELSGEVPKGLFTNISGLEFLKLSKNKLYGEVLSGNVSFTHIKWIYLDSNHFTGKIGINSREKKFWNLDTLVISNNFFTGVIPD